MSYKVGTFISLIILVLFAGIYAFHINSMDLGMQSSPIGPTFFPNLLAILLVILCAISFLQHLKKADETVPLFNVKCIFISIGLTFVFVIIWYYFEMFYVPAFLYISSLFILLHSDRNFKNIIKSLVIGLVFIIFVYFIFGQVMNVNF